MINICVITDGFPTKGKPAMYTFLRELLAAWSDMGCHIDVIYPVPYMAWDGRFQACKWVEKTKGNHDIQVYQPRFFSFSDKIVLGIRTTEIAYRSKCSAIMNTIRTNHLKPDFLYSHFLNNGSPAGEIGYKLGIPSFCAFGESTLWSIDAYSPKIIKERLARLNGIISVSSKNMRILIENDLFRADDIGVFPNGVDHKLFRKGNKLALREKFGVPTDEIIGIFTGSFNASKGPLRAQQAAVAAGNTKMIYIGGGTLKPEGSNIIFCGKLQHEAIPEYLSMADFFILPTQAEGCCNAIIEAMACGLPIISSDRAYNDDILTDDYAIRVDPDDVFALTNAINMLKNDPLKREEMGRKAEEASRQFDVFERAERILSFMREKAHCSDR